MISIKEIVSTIAELLQQKAQFKMNIDDGDSSCDDDIEEYPAPTDPDGKKNGSSVIGAATNLFNSTIGAGVIGLGGAIAGSGGLVSAVMMVAFAMMGKVSFDIIIELAIETGRGGTCSYEDLGRAAFGIYGTAAVAFLKWTIAFICLVAYTIIVRDNFSSALQHLFGLDENMDGFIPRLLLNPKLMTILLSTTVMLPLSHLRDMAPLVRFSVVKVATVYLIALVLVILYFQVRESDTSSRYADQDMTYEHWFKIQPNILANMCTILFGFVSQHTCHLIFQSLRPELRTVRQWKKVTTISTMLSILISYLIGFSAYMTFWDRTNGNLFLLYRPCAAVDMAKILLVIMQLLTYPAPFLACRELIILGLPLNQRIQEGFLPTENDLLLPKSYNTKPQASPWLLPGTTNQLAQPYHVMLTVSLWAISLLLALSSLSLIDVMNIGGAVSGTLLAFVLPGLFYFKLHGFSLSALILLVVGGLSGCLGTYYSISQAISK